MFAIDSLRSGRPVRPDSTAERRSVGPSTPEFYSALSKDAEFIFSGVQWVPEQKSTGSGQPQETSVSGSGGAGIGPGSSGTIYPAPTSINHTCGSDVTAAFEAWLKKVPATVVTVWFASLAILRITQLCVSAT